MLYWLVFLVGHFGCVHIVSPFPSSKAAVLRLQWASESSGGLVKADCWVPFPDFLSLVGLWWRENLRCLPDSPVKLQLRLLVQGPYFENCCSKSNIDALTLLNSFSFVLFHFVVSFKSIFSCSLFYIIIYSLYSFISIWWFFSLELFSCVLSYPFSSCFAVFFLESLYFCFVGLLYSSESFTNF